MIKAKWGCHIYGEWWQSKSFLYKLYNTTFILFWDWAMQLRNSCIATLTKQDWIFRHSRPVGTINGLELLHILQLHVQAAGTVTSTACSKHTAQAYFNSHMKDNPISIWQAWKLTTDCPNRSQYVYSWAGNKLALYLLVGSFEWGKFNANICWTFQSVDLHQCNVNVHRLKHVQSYLH